MNEQELEKQARLAAEIAGKLPDRFQEKCFEVLFKSLLSRNQEISSTEGVEASVARKKTSPFVVPIDVRALLHQYNVPDDALSRLFFMQGNEVRPTYNISTTKKSRAQVQVTLLAALEGALAGNGFKFSLETIRRMCRDQRCYDPDHFKDYFTSNSRLFKSLTDEEQVELSTDGKAELAEVILEMMGHPLKEED